MSERSKDSLSLSRGVLHLLVALNQLLGLLILALLAASLIAEGPVFEALGVELTGNDSTLVLGMRLIMVIGIVSVPFAHVVLTRLLAIVETVGAGSPFVTDNALRLRKIAWAFLGLELLKFGVGAVAAVASSETQPLDLDWSFSVTRWLAVLLLFVLARVFEEGTQMREDLEGTV
jgi:hypothetical protein